MSLLDPVTAGTELARALASRQQRSPLPNSEAVTDVFAADRLSLSRQALQQLQAEQQLASFGSPASQSVSVSSSTGHSQSRGNLSAEQALALYRRIASQL